MQNYIEQAVQTESNQFHSNLVEIDYFVETLESCIYHLQKLDEIKKALYYGKEIEKDNISASLNCFTFTRKEERITHSAIGIATEAGEMLQTLLKFAKEKRDYSNIKVDLVNVQEETGDVLWYLAILAAELHTNFDVWQNANIEKLRERYSDKFTAYDALNRDLTKERETLENNLKGNDDEQH